jgi:hypothetical protein
MISDIRKAPPRRAGCGRYAGSTSPYRVAYGGNVNGNTYLNLRNWLPESDARPTCTRVAGAGGTR